MAFCLITLCTLPSDPDDPSNTTLSLILEASDFQKSDTSVTDTVGKTIRIRLCLGMKKYIDSINVTIGTSGKNDTVIEIGKEELKKDTINCEMIFSTAGTRIVTAIAYVDDEFRKGTAKIHIVARNRKPELSITGQREITVWQQCTLVVSVEDPDIKQSYAIDSTKFPDDSRLVDSLFTWQTTQADTGENTIIFIVQDDGTPSLSDTEVVLITVNATVGYVNLTPRWNADTIFLDGVTGQPVSISLADEYSDPDDAALTVALLDESPSDAAVLNDTFSFTPTDDGIFYSYASVTDSSEASDTLVIQLTIIPADTLPPVLKLISPEDSAEISASSAQIKISATDESGILSVICISGSYSVPVTRSDPVFTSTVTGLIHNTFSTFTFIATDSSFFANSCTLIVSVKYDSTLLDVEGPVIIQTGGPISGNVVTDPEIVITDSIIDPSGVDSVCWILNGEYVDVMPKIASSMVSYRLRDTLENYRVNRLVIHAWDNAAAKNHDSSVVLIDYNIPPVVNDTAFFTARNTAGAWVMNSRSEDGDPLVWKQITVPSSLHFVVSGDLPDFTVTPATNWAGTDSFFVTVTDGYWSDTAKIVMTVENTLVAPKILTQPSGSTEYAGQSISFSVIINTDVNPAPTYQWKHDGDDMPGATASSYNIGTIAESDSGFYTVTITNSVGNVTSQPARLVVLPAGMRKIMASGKHFQMGQTGLADTAHLVEFTYDFFIDTTEVTQENYLDIMGVNPSNPSNDLAMPVQQVSWFDAVLYCNSRSNRYGKDTVYTYTSITGIAGNGCSAIANLVTHYDRNGFRLPTEAEWEYACRGGTGSTYFWGNDTDSVIVSQYAWWMGNQKAVAQKLPNAYGLYDMSGNVWEYCNDQYDDYPVPVYGSGIQTDPHGPAAGSARAVRGGSWYSSYITEFGSAARKFFVPQGTGSFTGFRAVLPIN